MLKEIFLIAKKVERLLKHRFFIEKKYPPKNYPLKLNIQFFAEGDPPEIDPPEPPKKEKKGEDTPQWAKNIQAGLDKLLGSQPTTPTTKTEVPAPQPPKVDEPDDKPKEPSTLKKFLDWLA